MSTGAARGARSGRRGTAAWSRSGSGCGFVGGTSAAFAPASLEDGLQTEEETEPGSGVDSGCCLDKAVRFEPPCFVVEILADKAADAESAPHSVLALEPRAVAVNAAVAVAFDELVADILAASVSVVFAAAEIETLDCIVAGFAS